MCIYSEDWDVVFWGRKRRIFLQCVENTLLCSTLISIWLKQFTISEECPLCGCVWHKGGVLHLWISAHCLNSFLCLENPLSFLGGGSCWRWWNSSRAISNPERWCCESATLSMSANLENSAVATGLEKVSFHSNPKERQCQRMLKLPHNCTHLTC